MLSNSNVKRWHTFLFFLFHCFPKYLMTLLQSPIIFIKTMRSHFSCTVLAFMMRFTVLVACRLKFQFLCVTYFYHPLASVRLHRITYCIIIIIMMSVAYMIKFLDLLSIKLRESNKRARIHI